MPPLWVASMDAPWEPSPCASISPFHRSVQ
jgi:hypothetical protein